MLAFGMARVSCQQRGRLSGRRASGDDPRLAGSGESRGRGCALGVGVG